MQHMQQRSPSLAPYHRLFDDSLLTNTSPSQRLSKSRNNSSFRPLCYRILTRRSGSYLTHEASGLDEHGEVQEAFLNGNDASQGKKEYLL
ncbi:hypothetical protein GOODEAATRI_009870 [Goodea atripinnis]|uniref:Uncharacterized protein n=1 Tax=Goodea atripinnis TaxID=208336 RepID=A0ABV0P348_9TELE